MNNRPSATGRSMSKSEISTLYCPEYEPHYARIVLNRWIARSPGLLDRLYATGYTPRQKLLTPAQVQLIYDALGEP